MGRAARREMPQRKMQMVDALPEQALLLAGCDHRQSFQSHCRHDRQMGHADRLHRYQCHSGCGRVDCRSDPVDPDYRWDFAHDPELGHRDHLAPIGRLEFLGSLVGIRIRKKMYFGVIIPVRDDVPLMQETDIQPWVDTAIEIYDRTCNIDLRFTGFCQTRIATPSVPLTVDCGAGGFFADFWLDGSWFEFTSRLCKFESNWRRLIGKGSEISVFIIDGYTGNSVGCSMSGTHDYVTVQAAPGPFPDTVAHEIGHACLLWHTSTGGTNLMDTGGRSTPQPVLNRVQIATVRSSRHCTYI